MKEIETPTQKAIEADGGIEVIDKTGRTRQITGNKLRNLSADTMSAIADKFGNGKLADLLEELTRAECVTNGGKKIADNRTRLAALQLALAYLLGRPVERQEVVTVNLDADNALGIKERLASSPALRDAIRKMLVECDDGAIIEAGRETVPK